MAPPVHKPGIEMGDIDTMSRLAAHENPTMPIVKKRCPTLTPTTMLNLPHDPLRKLLLLLDPHLTHPSTNDHHAAFIQVHRALDELINALSLRQHDPGTSSGHDNVPHREPQHRELPVQTLHERKYGTDILYRGKEMVRSYHKDWYRPAYANCPRRMAPPNRRAQNHYNYVGRGLHCHLCRVRTPTTKAARSADHQHILIRGPQIPRK